MATVPRDFLDENVNRYRKLIRGEPVDYAPFRFWLDDTFICEFARVAPVEYANNFEIMLGAQRAVNDRFCDLRDYTVDVNTNDIFFDREKFVADFPNIRGDRFLFQGLDDFDRYFSRKAFQEVPGVRKLEAGIRYFNDHLPPRRHASHYLGVWGALDLYSVFRGTGQFFLDLYNEPTKVKRIFDYISERSMAWLEYELSHWGDLNTKTLLFDKLDIGEDYCAYLPPVLFDEFVVPYTGRVFAEYRGRTLRSLHTDGDMPEAAISRLAKLNIDELMGFSPNIDISAFRAALPDVILAGNIHPIDVMINGTPDDVKAAAQYCFNAANQNQKFVLCTGGAICAGSKAENIDAFIEAAYEAVKYS